MQFEFKLPDLGEGIHEAQVLAWKVKRGEAVKAFQPLCEVESAKAAVELTSPVAGKVRETRVAEGDVAQLGEVLVVIDTDAEAPAKDEWFGIVGTAPQPGQTKKVFAAPVVRKLARDLNVSLEDVPGSGPQGRIRGSDVEAFVQRRSAPQAQPSDATASGRTIPLRGLRKAIAEHMVEAVQRAPQVTCMDLLDVTELVRARDILLPQANAENVKLTYLPFFVRAAVEALRAVPEANATVDEASSVIRLHDDFHIGIATAVPGGLVVPVVKHADRLSLLEIAREIERLVDTARDRRSSTDELSGGTFTITSFGGLPGSPMFATPILNYPEVAILGVGRIDLQPRVVDGQLVARQCAGVSFTFDHRVLDGEGAGRFMAVLKRYLEQPLELLLRLR
jgi:pyruvate dehydrogenase E2 component (dihydrolipoamide acetyltransferase)